MSRRGEGRTASHWPRVRGLVRPFRSRLVLLSSAAFGAGATEALFLVLVTRVGLSLADGGDTAGLVGDWSFTMGEAIAIGVALVVLRLVLSLAVASLSTSLTAVVRTDLRRQLTKAYLNTSWAVQQTEPSGRLSQLLTAFTNESVVVVTSLGNSLSASLSLAALLVGALLVDPGATLTVAIALPVLGMVLAPIRRRVKARSKAAATAQLGFASSVAELGALGLEMQTYGVRDRFAERVDELVNRDVRARRRADVLKAAAPVVYTSLAYVAMLGGLGLASVGGGDVAALGAVMLVLLRSLTYGQQLQTASVNLIQAMPFLERLDETIATYEADVASGGAVRPQALGAIELRDVSFGYVPGRPVLSDVSVRIERGETVGIIGPSGAGKSTLVQLLLGVRDPSAGQVLVDGTDLREVDRRWWSERVAFVAQDALLFTGTVAENVRFFRNGIDDAAVRGAAARAHVLTDVEALPDGFDTHLGERGSQLSGGQRQRLSIARALAGGPDVLILDEPTSALDMRSELLIRETLAELHGEKTVIVIAHRMSTLQECDRLLVVDDGRLVAQGPPAALRNENEFYRRALELSGIA